MKAANLLLERVPQIAGVQVRLLGSLGATGRGHGTDRAVVAGLAGLRPETVLPEQIAALAEQVAVEKQLPIQGRVIRFDVDADIEFRPTQRLPFHPNGIIFVVESAQGRSEHCYYSVGGGAVVADWEIDAPVRETVPLPHAFRTGQDLLRECANSGLSVGELALRNEVAAGRSREEVSAELGMLWELMCECINAGCHTEGVLPGGLGVRRRAPRMLRQLKHASGENQLEWVSLWALAVNEQNAAGGRMVTAPTNGAAGIVPAVLKHAMSLPGSDAETPIDFLLAAGAIGEVYRATASISGAEVGCQGEIGVACSMAAAGLAEVLGGSPEQVVNAAEIGLEHHLGLTCDPVAGLVQVPCIERNAIGATTAITAARLALAGDGRQIVSLDQVISAMMATGADMATKYKETAAGGLATLVQC
jgi:L-serine dehydratase